VNLLLIGAAPRLDALLERIRRLAESPIGVCALPGRLALPDAGRVLLRDVAALSRDQQETLLRWTNEGRTGVQIISASSQRLFNRVKAGLFSDQLYYRLNTVVVYV
jgi:DNA-binding NtrC family response regulator